MRLPLPHQLATKITGLLLGFLMLALSAIGATLLLSWQLEGSSAAINEAGSLRMHSYKLATMLSRQVAGDAAGRQREDALAQIELIEHKFASLRRGEPQRPLMLPQTDAIASRFAEIAADWRGTMRPLAMTVLDSEGMARQVAWVRFESQVRRFVFDVDQLVHLIERDSELRTFWLRLSQFALAGMALVGTVAVIYLLYLLIITPVTRLREGIESMTRKDFSARVAVDSRDEFGDLAAGFNRMADRLEESYRHLEERVREKTATLAQQNRELALLYDTAAFLQQPQDVHDMCDGFLRRIAEYFGADGATVRTLDERRGNLHMVVHRGISDALAETEHCMKVGECLCGEAVQNKVTVLHDLRGAGSEPTLACVKEGFGTVAVFQIHAQQ